MSLTELKTSYREHLYLEVHALSKSRKYSLQGNKKAREYKQCNQFEPVAAFLLS